MSSGAMRISLTVQAGQCESERRGVTGAAVARPAALAERSGLEPVHVAIASPAGMHDATIYDPLAPAATKSSILPSGCRACGVPLPEAPTNGSGEPTRIGS